MRFALGDKHPDLFVQVAPELLIPIEINVVFKKSYRT
jgi:hypothetical protein